MVKFRFVNKIDGVVLRDPGFEITEKSGRKTLGYLGQRGDFILEQTLPTGKKSFIAHYSNPGFMVYSTALKFLFENGFKGPPLGKKRVQSFSNPDLAFYISTTSRVRFPLEYSPDPSSRDFVKITTAKKRLYGQELNFSYGGKKICLSLSVAKLIVNLIPRINPSNYKPDFEHIFLTLRKAFVRKKPLKPVRGNILRRRAKQVFGVSGKYKKRR